MGFAIIATSKHNKENFIALVDRNITKRKWWTSNEPNIIKQFNTLQQAQQQLAKYTKNNPRVISFNKAVSVVTCQAREQKEAEEQRWHDEACEAMEQGWDGHKNVG